MKFVHQSKTPTPRLVILRASSLERDLWDWGDSRRPNSKITE
jgi:hypothetical protein